MYVDKAGFPLATNQHQHQYPRSRQHRPQFNRQPVAGKTKSKKSKAFSACRIVTVCITDEDYSQPVAEEKDDTFLITMPASSPAFSAVFDSNNSFQSDSANAEAPVSSPIFSAPVPVSNDSFKNASLTKSKRKSILRDITNRMRIHGGGPIADKHQKDTFEPEISFVEENSFDAIKYLVNHDFDRDVDNEMENARRRLLFAQTPKSITPVINNKSESIPVTSTKEAVDSTSALGETFNCFYAATGEGEASFTTIGVSFDDTKRTEGGLENNKFEIESYLKGAFEIFEDLRTEMASAFSVSEWQNYLAKMPNEINSTCHVLKSKIC